MTDLLEIQTERLVFWHINDEMSVVVRDGLHVMVQDLHHDIFNRLSLIIQHNTFDDGFLAVKEVRKQHCKDKKQQPLIFQCSFTRLKTENIYAQKHEILYYA